MILHRVTHRIAGEAPIVCLLPDSKSTRGQKFLSPEALRAEADKTYEEFVAAAQQLERTSLVEHEIIDTQVPAGTEGHIRPVRQYAA
jgi:hypothetical protein